MTEQHIGRYRVLEEIGSGGQAIVYRCLDPKTDQVVAIKVLRAESSQDQTFVTRFRREAQIATSINHDNIVRLFEVGEHAGLLYTVLEYVPKSLGDLLEGEETLPVERAAEITAAIADGLSVAHEAGIVHRDIKPQNILVTEDDVPKVTVDRGTDVGYSSITGWENSEPISLSFWHRPLPVPGSLSWCADHGAHG